MEKSLRCFALVLWILLGAHSPAQDLPDIVVLRDEGTSLRKAGRLAESQQKRLAALELAKKAIANREKEFGPMAPELIPFLKIAGLLSVMTAGQTAPEKDPAPGPAPTSAAIEYYERALKIAEQAYGPDHPETADALDGYAGRLGRATQALELMERAREIRRAKFGPDSLEFARSLLLIGGWQAQSKGGQNARESLDTALAIFESKLTPEKLGNFGEYLDLFPLMYMRLSDFPTAQQAQGRIAALRSRLTNGESENDPDLVARQALGITNPVELARLHERLLALEEKKYGADTSRPTNTLAKLFRDYRQTGELDKAAVAIERLLAISRREPTKPDAQMLFRILYDAVLFYEFFGDYEKAQPLRRRLLELVEAEGEKSGEALPVLMLGLALNHRALGENDQAQAILDRAVARPWPEPVQPIGVLVQLGPVADLRFERGDYEEAAALYTRFDKIFEELKLAALPQHGDGLHRLGQIAHSRGQLAEAADYFRRARAIFAAPPPQMPGIVTERATSPAGLVKLAHDEALLALERGAPDEAVARENEAEAARRDQLKKILAFGSERQRLAFQASFDPYMVWAAANRPVELAQNVFCYKGLVLDSLLEDQRRARRAEISGQHDLYQELRRTRLILAELEFSATTGGRKIPGAEDPRPALTAKIEELQNRITVAVAGMGPSPQTVGVTPAEVQQTLPAHGALIEYLRYRHPLAQRKFEPRYGALVLTRSGEPRWVPLGTAETVEKAVLLYQKSCRGKTDETTLQNVLGQLFEQVWKPVAEALPSGITTLTISPDAALNTLSFATLIDPAGRFLAENFSLKYVASGRDLLPRNLPASTDKHCAIFANPSFSLQHPASTASAANLVSTMRASDQMELSTLSFSSLPGTAREAAEVGTLVSQQGLNPDLHLEKEAREATLSALRSPRILHLATHGFVLPDRVSTDLASQAPLAPRNPMLRSGLALAGAEDTLKAWKDGRAPVSSDDGILTAEEVASLSLEGTWLVTVSACDTGNGEVRVGEGVLGLRRGFAQAGARHLLTTLWPISDETTAEIMLDFYRHAFVHGNPPQALAETQRAWLIQLRKEKGLQEAVNRAGPFIMNVQGGD